MADVIFHYFREPHRFSTYTEEANSCDICGRERAGYEGPFYGEGEIEFVCERCLASGRLAEHDAFTNQGDREALALQIRRAGPQLTEAEIEALVSERSAEVEERTPHLVTWQDIEWPAHCGDYACFVKEAGKPDLIALSPDGDGRTFLEEHLYDGLTTDLDDLWESVRPDSPTSDDTSYACALYLFQCLHCQDYTILWDME